jgi:hypothetical protein
MRIVIGCPDQWLGSEMKHKIRPVFIDNMRNVLLIEDITPDIRNMVAQSGLVKKRRVGGGCLAIADYFCSQGFEP